MNRYPLRADGAPTKRIALPFANATGRFFVCLFLFSFASLYAATISGTVFDDVNSDGLPSGGEAVNGVMLRVHEDDGDGVFTASADVQIGEEITTGNDGVYAFPNLDPTKGYFVVQPGQSVGDFSYTTTIGDLYEPSGPVIMIDEFFTVQEVVASPVDQTAGSSKMSSVLGGQRDFYIEHMYGSADSKLRSNPYGLNSVLEFNQSAGVSATGTITWDGMDANGSTPVMGLGGIDLTNGGLNVGIELSIGIDAAGSGDTFTMRLYEGSAENFSEAVVPVPTTLNGTATKSVVVPFSAFQGSVSADKVDAIQLELGGQQPSIDMQLNYVGVIGPHVRNMAVSSIVPQPSVPEPSTDRLLKFMGVWFVFGLLGFRRESWFPSRQRRTCTTAVASRARRSRRIVRRSVPRFVTLSVISSVNGKPGDALDGGS